MERNASARLCLFLDVQGYSKRSNNDQIRVQSWLVDLIERSADLAGLSNDQFVRQEQGDGCLILVDPQIEVPAVLSELIEGLNESLDWINEPLRDMFRMRIRAALDYGVVRQAANGYVGRAVIGAARLANCRELREALSGSADSPLAVAVSNNLYQHAVDGGSQLLLSGLFERTVVHEKEYLGWAWMAALVPMKLPDDSEEEPEPFPGEYDQDERFDRKDGLEQLKRGVVENVE